MKEKEIVFICDQVVNHDDATILSKDLEKPSINYYNDVLTALNNICNNVICYDKPKEFIDNISNHQNSLVYSLWSGENSRNRRALVPSICEAYNIMYIGADSYIQTICADKHLSKRKALTYGIKSAKDITITFDSDLKKLSSINYPAVVKPNFEGGSIGIFKDNLVDNKKEAFVLCKKLLKHYHSLIVEEYIDGFELSVCIAGKAHNIDVFESIKIIVNDNDYFHHDILGAEIKKMCLSNRRKVVDNTLITLEEKETLINFYNSLGKVEVMRIDGRVNQNGFHLIELTPDCSMSKTGSISTAFKAAGYTYDQMFELLCKNALSNHRK